MFKAQNSFFYSLWRDLEPQMSNSISKYGSLTLRWQEQKQPLSTLFGVYEPLKLGHIFRFFIFLTFFQVLSVEID